MGSQLCHYKSDVKGRALCSGNAVRLIHTRIWLNGRLNNVLDLSFIHQWPLQRQLGLCKMTWIFYTISYPSAEAEHTGNLKESDRFLGMFIRPGMPLSKW